MNRSADASSARSLRPTHADEASALVRLKWCVVGVVKVRSLAAKSREATDRNCAGATRGGEQRKVNGQSVTNASLGREAT